MYVWIFKQIVFKVNFAKHERKFKFHMTMSFWESVIFDTLAQTGLNQFNWFL